MVIVIRWPPFAEENIRTVGHRSLLLVIVVRFLVVVVVLNLWLRPAVPVVWWAVEHLRG